jgi:molecular chaperone DnaK (HSP70)
LTSLPTRLPIEQLRQSIPTSPSSARDLTLFSSLVSFGPRQRSIGEAAKTQEISNYKNTIGSLKRLIGRSFGDPDVEIEKKFLNAQLVDVNGSVGVKVSIFRA